jgi:ATP-dependent helicase/nuclease subunit A
VRGTPPEAGALGRLVESLAALWCDADVDRLRGWGRSGFGGKSDAGPREALGADAPAAALAARDAHRHLEHALALDARLLRLAYRALAPLLAEAEALLRRRGVETFAGLLQDAFALLARDAEVAARVRREIDQLLVDEFQDTDALQCEILRRIALEGEPAGRPGLFLVGDPKQSIYGWRSADLRAYDGFLEGVRAAGGRHGILCVNHRSSPEVLEEVERVIEPSMAAEPGVQPRFQRLLPAPGRARGAEAAATRQAPVEHWISWGFDRASGAPRVDLRAGDANRLEARALARDLLRLAESGARWSEVALLMRSVGDADVYLHELRRAGIPYVVERDRHYHERREVIDARALVRAILDPHDQVALVAVLRSAVVGAPDAALVPLWRRGFPGHFARLASGSPAALAEAQAAAREAAAATPADVPGIERVRGWEENLVAFLGAAARLREAARSEAPDRFVELLRASLLLEASEAARSLGAYRVANLDRFFRDLAASLDASGGDASAVVAALRSAVTDRREEEEGRPRDAADEAVRVLTIHGAKGLQFEHVYLLQLHKGSRREERFAPRVERRGGRLALRLFGQSSLELVAVARDRARVEEAELVRTLYVAMTRAKRRLVLAGKRGGAEGHQALLAARREGSGDLARWMAELAKAGGPPHLDALGARFVFPALEAEDDDALREPEAGRGEDFTAASVLAASRELAGRRARAKGAEARPFHAAASEGRELAAERLSEARYGRGAEEAEGAAPAGSVSRSEAQALGSAVHALLESTDLALLVAADPAALARELGARLPDDLSPAGRARALELAEALARGPLPGELRRLSPHVLARELPVLLEGDGAGGAGAPVGFWSGAIDLLYRDPERGEYVVADYKTDRVGAAEVRATAERYRAQGAVYARAVQRALGLPRPPRFELWFLVPGEVVVIGRGEEPASR